MLYIYLLKEILITDTLFFIYGVVKFKTMKNYRFTSIRKNSKIKYKDFVRGVDVKEAISNFEIASKDSEIIKIELL